MKIKSVKTRNKALLSVVPMMEGEEQLIVTTLANSIGCILPITTGASVLAATTADRILRVTNCAAAVTTLCWLSTVTGKVVTSVGANHMVLPFGHSRVIRLPANSPLCGAATVANTCLLVEDITAQYNLAIAPLQAPEA